jgi:outer membrane protein TolC
MPCATVLALAVAACASFTNDGGMTPVAQHVAVSLGKETAKIASLADAEHVRDRVTTLLARPLTADSAVQIALINNRGLQAEYNALGISEAAYVEASLPPNPVVSVGRMVAAGELEIERRLVANLLSLFSLPARSAVAKTQFEAARLRAVEATFRLAAETRRAYYRAVASREKIGFLEKARQSVDAATDLTIKLGETGAATRLDQTRASAFYAETSNQLAEARLQAALDRENLTRRMGLWGSDIDYRLPPRLPDLPARLPQQERLEAEAMRTRVDLIAARMELDAQARALRLTDATRFVSMLELAGISNETRKVEGAVTEINHPRGFELEIQVPIFDGGEAGVRKSQETYMQAVNQLAEKAVNARSEVRASFLAYRGTYDIARQFRDRIVPMRESISEQAVLEYNGMLIDVFDLLTTVRESIASNIAAIDAKRAFFLASIDFQAALIGGGAPAAEDAKGTAMTAAAESGGH